MNFSIPIGFSVKLFKEPIHCNGVVDCLAATNGQKKHFIMATPVENASSCFGSLENLSVSQKWAGEMHKQVCRW